MSNLKMTSCPVCDSQNESNALLCNICGWDLAPYPLTFGGIPESYLEKERAKIKWAKEQWQKLSETERINLANVKILQEHEQQHRLNKQQIQSQQEQLQLQTKLLEQQRSDSQQESKLLMDKLEELACNLDKVQSTVDRIESDKSILMKQNWLTSKGVVTNPTDSADNQTKSWTSETKPEVPLPVIPKNQSYIDIPPDDCIVRDLPQVKQAKQEDGQKIEMNGGKVSVHNQLLWLRTLLQDWHDDKHIRVDEIRFAISLADELIKSIPKIRKRIDTLEFRQNAQIIDERENFERRLKVKDNFIDDLERQIKELNKKLREQSSWSNQLQSLMPKFTRAEQDRDNYYNEVKSLRRENTQLQKKLEQQRERPQVQKNDINISSLQDTLISNLDRKAFSEKHPIYTSDLGIESNEFGIRKSIEKQILAITDAKTLQDLNAFLLNTARSLNAFYAEVNRVTSSSSNN